MDFICRATFSAWNSPTSHTLSAEAIGDTKVLVIKRTALDALAGRNASTAQQFFALTGRELTRVQDHILLLIKSAQERVAGFVLEMAERGPRRNIVELPMSRQDIGDYLGLSLETVSRTLSGDRGFDIAAHCLANRDALRSG